MKVRNTKIKSRVTAVLQTQTTPLSLKQLYGQVKKKLPKTAYSTVFRITQQLLEDKKLVSVDWKERGKRFEWADRKHHHHLVCDNCGDTKDIDDTLLNIKIEKVNKETGFVVNDHAIELRGMCPPCQTKI